MSRENVAGDAEDEYFENGLQMVSLLGKRGDRSGDFERELTSKTVTTRDQYGGPMQKVGVGCE